ncbi:MAG TPA: tRNA pseudouridine(55) synthase TruB, partial [Gammaproteobacteria bacterium]|nr:tRNA pseudouridine(55) synthase TruB [Gammaproteobacteria bacterium]
MTRGETGKYRDVDGILLLDKPTGPSSNQALQRVRRLYRARKAGHCGSLDPLATGVLPICFGQATRFSSYLLGASKTYRASCRLGRTTTTGDAEGDTVETLPVSVEVEQVERVLKQFVGSGEQLPPMYSALKHEGRRLYELAREGRQVERRARRIEIYRLELLSFEPRLIEIEVHCSKGTYIRTLAEDVGRELGCGAHLAALRRTAVDALAVGDCHGLARLEELAAGEAGALDALLLPAGAALERYPELELQADSARDIRDGKRLKM